MKSTNSYSLKTDKALGRELEEVFHYSVNRDGDSVYDEKWKFNIGILQQTADTSIQGDEFRKYRDQWDKNIDEETDYSNRSIIKYLEKCQMKVFKSLLSDEHDVNDNRLRIYSLYNMGYVICENGTKIGVDISARQSELIADKLDLLIVTHQHRDHWTPRLVEKMIQINKSVYTSNHTEFPKGVIRVSESVDIKMKGFGISIKLGDQSEKKGWINDNLLVEIVSSSGISILHTGDNSNVQKIETKMPINILIAHVNSYGCHIRDVIKKVQPTCVIPSHWLELSHNDNDMEPSPRWTMNYLMEIVGEYPKEFMDVILWGSCKTYDQSIASISSNI